MNYTLPIGLSGAKIKRRSAPSLAKCFPPRRLTSPCDCFFFTLAGCLSTDYLYVFFFYLAISFSLVTAFLLFFLAARLSSFHAFSVTYSHTFLALMQLSYYTNFPRHLHFAILRCAHFETLCLNSALLRKLCVLNYFDFGFLS